VAAATGTRSGGGAVLFEGTLPDEDLETPVQKVFSKKA
jgi:hypothetical protein